MERTFLKIAANNWPTKFLAVVLLTTLALPRPVEGASYNLTDNGSSAFIDADSGAGMSSWIVSGTDHLEKQWFYYRVGNGGTAQAINTISSSTLLFNNANSLYTSYTAAGQFTLTISYVLTGGSFGVGSADILETVSVQNLSGAPLDFHLFQYSNFDLLGNPAGDTVQFLGMDSVTQTKGVFGIQEGIIQPPASHREAGFAGPGGTLDNLTTLAGYNLNDGPGPLVGDVTWAFQWDYSIGVGQSLDVYKDKTLIVPVIPEPSTLSLIAIGLGALGWFNRRRVF